LSYGRILLLFSGSGVIPSAPATNRYFTHPAKFYKIACSRNLFGHLFKYIFVAH